MTISSLTPHHPLAYALHAGIPVEDDRGLWQLHIVSGDSPEATKKMKLLQMPLIGGKRELLHAGDKSISREISVTKVEEEKE